MPNLTYCPTLLCTPDLPPSVDREDMFSWPDTHRLPLEVGKYSLAQDGENWMVWEVATAKVVYSGRGPVELVSSPVPF